MKRMGLDGTEIPLDTKNGPNLDFLVAGIPEQSNL
jgi:hypothetical protein